jgi:hypothetical protein
MGPLLYAAVADQPGMIPEGVRARLRSADRWARVHGADMREAAVEIVDQFAAKRVPLTLLKGLSVADPYYEEFHHRFVGDLDILVDPRDAHAAQIALAELGYRPTPEAVRRDYSRHHHLPPVRHPETRVCVELHTGLFPPLYGLDRAGPFALATLREERRASSFAGRPVGRLSPELQVLYIASHWALDFVPTAGARALLDMALLLRAEPGLDWGRVAGWLEDPRVAAHLELMLRFLAAQGVIEPPVGLSTARRSPPVLEPASLHVLCEMVERYQARGMMRHAEPIERAGTRAEATRPPMGRGNLGSRLRTLRRVCLTRDVGGLQRVLDSYAWVRLLGRPRAKHRSLIAWCRLFPPGDPARFRARRWLAALAALLRPSRSIDAPHGDGAEW